MAEKYTNNELVVRQATKEDMFAVAEMIQVKLEIFLYIPGNTHHL